MYFSHNKLSVYEVLSSQNNEMDESYRHRVLDDRQLLLIELFDAADMKTQDRAIKLLDALKGTVN